MRGSAASRERPGGPAARGRTVTARGNRRGDAARWRNGRPLSPAGRYPSARNGSATHGCICTAAARAGTAMARTARPPSPADRCPGAREAGRGGRMPVYGGGARTAGGGPACGYGTVGGPMSPATRRLCRAGAPAGPVPSRGRRLGRAAASGGMCGGATGCPRPGSPGRWARPGRLLGRDGRADGVRGPRPCRARAARRPRGRRRPVRDGPSGPGAPGAGAKRCAAPAGPGRGRPVTGDRRPYGWRRYTGEACGRSYGRRTCGGSAPHLVPASRRAVMVARRSPW